MFGVQSNYAQTTKINVTLHARVDTTQAEVKAVAQLWINYLNAQSDSVYDNPFWNAAEKKQYKDFDLSRAFIYQFPARQLLQTYSPTVLSVVKEGDAYAIRTLFAAEGLEGNYKKSNPWCITKLYAINENGNWKLKNALPIITQHWRHTTVGRITFIYPPHHAFDSRLAHKANAFCDSLSKVFQFLKWKPFDFYITENSDELGELLNFDFFFSGHTTGVAMYDSRIVLSGFGSEWYPHEFVHLIVPPANRHALINEGFATWLGGAMEKTFKERAHILAKQLAKNDTVTFTDVLHKQWGWQYAAFYTSGAIWCEAAYKKGGLPMVQQLLAIPPDDKQLITALSQIFGINKEDVNQFWRSAVLEYQFIKPSE